MIWQRKGRYYLESDCGLYTVSRSLVSGKIVYTAWQRVPKAAPIRLGLRAAPADDAAGLATALQAAKELCASRRPS
jgi:hypothetical protein